MTRNNCLRMGAYPLVAVCLVWLVAASAHAQPAIFSFEDPADLDPWLLGSTQSLSQSSFGATDGESALLISGLTSLFKNNIVTTPNFGPATAGLADAFRAFNDAAQIIAGGGTPQLEFDLAWDFSQAGEGYVQLGLFVSSSTAGGGGYKNYGTGQFINGPSGLATWPTLGAGAEADGVVLTSTGENSLRVAIPFGAGKTMTLSNESTYFDIGFQSNGNWTGTVDFAIDNIRFTGVPVYEEHTLFSWETPDNPATPGIDERFEGWMPNPDVSPVTQNLSITSTGATDGSYALQLDRTPLKDGFTWGSMFGLDATANPDDQTRIDDFVSRINNASQIAIDITYEDQFPISPTGTRLYLAFADDAGTWYQAGSASFNINNKPPGTMETLIFDLETFEDYNNPGNTLANTGLLVGTSQLGIVLGTATNDGAIYQIDNFRLITEVVDSLPGDFNNDGQVDGRDFLTWQRGGSPNPLSAGDLAEWQAAYGGGGNLSAATAAVPEPSSVLLVAVSLLALGIRRP